MQTSRNMIKVEIKQKKYKKGNGKGWGYVSELNKIFFELTRGRKIQEPLKISLGNKSITIPAESGEWLRNALFMLDGLWAQIRLEQMSCRKLWMKPLHLFTAKIHKERDKKNKALRKQGRLKYEEWRDFYNPLTGMAGEAKIKNKILEALNLNIRKNINDLTEAEEVKEIQEKYDLLTIDFHAYNLFLYLSEYTQMLSSTSNSEEYLSFQRFISEMKNGEAKARIKSFLQYAFTISDKVADMLAERAMDLKPFCKTHSEALKIIDKRSKNLDENLNNLLRSTKNNKIKRYWNNPNIKIDTPNFDTWNRGLRLYTIKQK